MQISLESEKQSLQNCSFPKIVYIYLSFSLSSSPRNIAGILFLLLTWLNYRMYYVFPSYFPIETKPFASNLEHRGLYQDSSISMPAFAKSGIIRWKKKSSTMKPLHANMSLLLLGWLGQLQLILLGYYITHFLTLVKKEISHDDPRVCTLEINLAHTTFLLSVLGWHWYLLRIFVLEQTFGNVLSHWCFQMCMLHFCIIQHFAYMHIFSTSHCTCRVPLFHVLLPCCFTLHNNSVGTCMQLHSLKSLNVFLGFLTEIRWAIAEIFSPPKKFIFTYTNS